MYHHRVGEHLHTQHSFFFFDLQEDYVKFIEWITGHLLSVISWRRRRRCWSLFFSTTTTEGVMTPTWQSVMKTQIIAGGFSTSFFCYSFSWFLLYSSGSQSVPVKVRNPNAFCYANAGGNNDKEPASEGVWEDSLTSNLCTSTHHP